MMFQRETKSLSGTLLEPKTDCILLVSQEYEFKGKELIYFYRVEEISRQGSIQTLSWLLLTFSIQVISERVQKVVQNDKDNVGFGEEKCEQR